MNAVIIADNVEEKTLLAHVVQQAGLSIRYAPDVFTLLQDWTVAPVDLVILAQPLDNPAETVRRLRMMTAATILVITNFISDDIRLVLYEAGADLVLLRPYSPRLLVVQTWTMAQQGFDRSARQPAKQANSPLPPESTLQPRRQPGKALMYS